MYHVNENVNLTVKHIIQIKFRITRNVDVTAKIQEKGCAKTGIFEILLRVVVDIADMQKSLLMIQQLQVIKS